MAAFTALGWMVAVTPDEIEVRDELVGAWCALTEYERGEVEDFVPDVACLLERMTGQVRP